MMRRPGRWHCRCVYGRANNLSNVHFFDWKLHETGWGLFVGPCRWHSRLFLLMHNLFQLSRLLLLNALRSYRESSDTIKIPGRPLGRPSQCARLNEATFQCIQYVVLQTVSWFTLMVSCIIYFRFFFFFFLKRNRWRKRFFVGGSRPRDSLFLVDRVMNGYWTGRGADLLFRKYWGKRKYKHIQV